MFILSAPAFLWVTRDGRRLVKDGDPDAAVLWVRTGQRVEASRVDRFQNGREMFGIKDEAEQQEEEAPAPKRLGRPPKNK